jgi:competence protein ComEA
MSIKHVIGTVILGVTMFVGAASADKVAAPKPAEKAPAEKPAEKPAEAVALVDINSATQEQLEALPGIGKEHCHHIIYGRPYGKKEELVSKQVLPQEVYAKVEHLVIAKAPPPKKKSKR